MRRFSIFLVVVVLVAGMIACAEPVQYTLNISSTEGGEITTPGEETSSYEEGTEVPLVALPQAGYRFAGWTGDVGTIANVNSASTTITMDNDCAITANFAVKQYDLAISSTEGGSVTSPGEGISIHEEGTAVNLVAQPDEGYQFVQWTGNVGAIADVSAAETTITMNSDYSITANFAGAIRDWYDLDAIRDSMDGSYVLTNDLDSNTAGYSELGSPTADGRKGWQPIGDYGHPFTGWLDGQGYRIEDLFIDRPDEDGVGLFGCLGEGVIENLGMVNAEVTGHIYVGGLLGDNHHGNVSNCHFDGGVTGYGGVGGLVGRNELGSHVTNSYSAGRVTGSDGHHVGGLVGRNFGEVTNSYSTSSVTADLTVGGLVGGNWGSVLRSYAAGGVTGGWTVGGLVGWNHIGTVRDSYSTGSVSGYGSVGGLVGQHHDGTVINSYYSYDEVLLNGRSMITIGALSGEDFNQWSANGQSLDVNDRLSQEDGYYLINSVTDFKQLLAFGQDGSLKFRLMEDLDLGGDPDFYIPYLAGEFDGNGHTIANLRFSSDFSSQVGLFGYIASSGAVSELSVENVDMTGHAIVGGLVGENDGTVSNSYSTGRVDGYWSVGGLVGCIGWNGGTVSNSHYNYDEFLINGTHAVTIGALFDDDFGQWLANGGFLDVNERLSQESGYYLISNLGDFKQLLTFGQDSSLKFRLTTDLHLSSEPNFYIPYLAGEFAGNGHKISNLDFHSDHVGQVGLFGYIGSAGRVSEVGIENVNITATNAEGIGGLAGANSGAVSNSYSTGSLNGGNHVGGLVGWNEGTVSNSYATGAVAGEWGTGGLVGWNYGGGTVSSSYSTGRVTGSGEGPVGGLIGSNEGSESSSFWGIQTSGQAISDGGTGKATAEMKNIATFSAAGWNIIAVAPGERNTTYSWNIVDGQTYPFLSWQSVS